MPSYVPYTIRHLAYIFIPACTLGTIYLGLHTTNVFPDLFESSSYTYLIYNVLKLALIPILLLLLHNLGDLTRKIASRHDLEFNFESATINTGVGLATLNLTVYITGLFGWYSDTPYIILVLCLFLVTWKATEKLYLLFFTFNPLPIGRMIRSEFPLWIVFSAILATVIILKSVTPDVMDNDVLGGYIPYYATAKDYGTSLWDTWFFIHFFIGKGGGLQVLITQLVDAHSINLAGGCALVLCLAVYISGGLRLTANYLFLATGAVASLLMLHCSVSLAKPHLLVSSIIGCLLLSILRATEQTSSSTDTKFSCLILILGAVVATPVSAGILGPFLGLLVGLALIIKRKDLALWFLTMTFVLAVTLVGSFAINTEAVGLPDYTLSILDFFGNFEAMSKHWSPVGIYLQRAFNQSDFSLALPQTEIIGTYISSLLFDMTPQINGPLAGLCIIILLFSGLVASVFRKRQGETVAGFEVVGVSFCFLAILICWKYIMNHGAQDRFTLIRFILGSWLVIFSLDNLSRLARPGWPRNILIFTALCGWIATLVPATILTVNLVTHWRLNFLVRGSLGSFYDLIYPVADGLAAARLIPPGERILCLNFSPGLYALPGQTFQRPFQNAIIRDIHEVLYNSPSRGKEALIRNKTPYAFFTMREIPIIHILSPALSPDGLATHWKLLWRSGKQPESFLFTSKPSEGSPIPADILNSIKTSISTKGVHMGEVYAAGREEALRLGLIDGQ